MQPAVASLAGHADEEYLSCDPLQDESDIRAQRVRLVHTRKQHDCALGLLLGEFHAIPVGTRALCETAVVEGMWQTNYVCLPCLDKYIEDELE